jgi:F-type H+-transporting ATPase subunit b
MKREDLHIRLGWLLIVVGLGLLLSGNTAWAAESAGGWRPVYDLVMRWINFLILVFVLVKYGRKPLKNFLKQRQQDIADQIGALENEKAAVLSEVDEKLKAIDDSQERFENMKARIMRQGEKRKQEIIEAGKTESAMRIDSAKRKIQHQIFTAQEQLRAELIDAAFDIALEKLPALVNDADNERKLQQFYAQIESR